MDFDSWVTCVQELRHERDTLLQFIKKKGYIDELKKVYKQTYQLKSQILDNVTVSKDESETLQNHKRQRGRPKGSKNKPKTESLLTHESEKKYKREKIITSPKHNTLVIPESCEEHEDTGISEKNIKAATAAWDKLSDFMS